MIKLNEVENGHYKIEFDIMHSYDLTGEVIKSNYGSKPYVLTIRCYADDLFKKYLNTLEEVKEYLSNNERFFNDLSKAIFEETCRYRHGLIKRLRKIESRY